MSKAVCRVCGLSPDALDAGPIATGSEHTVPPRRSKVCHYLSTSSRAATILVFNRCQAGSASLPPGCKLTGRLADAIAHYEEALRLRPDFVDARNNLAVYYATTGRWEAAIGQLEIAARLAPASTAIRDNLEKLKTRQKAVRRSRD